jgi:hypothetical protein
MNIPALNPHTHFGRGVPMLSNNRYGGVFLSGEQGKYRFYSNHVPALPKNRRHNVLSKLLSNFSGGKNIWKNYRKILFSKGDFNKIGYINFLFQEVKL